MAKSNLVYLEVPAHPSNYTKGRLKPIRRVTIHHMAGVLSAKNCGGIFARAGRNGSSHYGIGNDGEIASYVDENDTAWTNSNWPSNCESVTIEVSNSKMNGNWPVSDKALDSLVKLVAGIAKRNNLGKLVKGENLTWHNMFANTNCPGEYLMGKLDEIVEKANAINGYMKPADTPKAPEAAKKTDEQMADEVIEGKWGNGDDRKNRLAEADYDYAKIQAIVNARLKPADATKAPEAAAEGIKVGDKVTLTKLVDEKGTRLVKTRDFYFAAEIKGERVVLRADSMSGTVYAAVNIKNLKKA